jgi:Fuc2NAc and GlcNAc transferase
LALSLIALIGWLDDRSGISAKVRLLTHLAAAGILAAWTFKQTDLHWIWLLAGVFSMAWNINLTNFMDGIDGIATSQTIALIIGFLAITHGQADAISTVIALSALASCIVFLKFNWSPARVFLGDVGSGTLGFINGALWLTAFYRGSLSLPAIFCLTSAFSMDTGITLVRRLARGQNPAQAHRDHAYQHACRIHDFRHWQVALGYALYTAILAAPVAYWVQRGFISAKVGLALAHGPALVWTIRMRAGTKI